MTREEVYKLIEEHYRENYQRLINQCRRSLNNHHSAEDVVQEAYTRACQYWNSFQATPKKFDQWFHSIITNCMRDQRRDDMVRGQAVDTENIHLSHDDGRTGERRITLDEIGKLINDKTEDNAYIFRLFFFEQYQPQDIAKLTDLAPRAISMRIDRFKQELKDVYS